MNNSTDPFFDRRLATLVRDVLDAQSGPHSTWSDSPAARRVAGGETDRRWKVGGWRLLAIAAVLSVGGAAAAGALLRDSFKPPLPAPTPSPSTSAVAGPRNGMIAYDMDGEVAVRLPAGQETFIRGVAESTSCPEFGADGLLAMKGVGQLGQDPPSWNIEVIRLQPDASSYEPERKLQITERSEDGVPCFEWSPDGDWFAYTTNLGDDVQFTIAREGLFLSPVNISRDHAAPIADFVRWRPDSAAAAFVSSYDPQGDGRGMYSQVDLAFVDASEPVIGVLRSEPNELINDLAWSPDGASIAYRATRFMDGEPSGTFVRLEKLGPVSQHIALDELNDPEMTLGAGPAWSPDGSQVAWVLGGELRVGAPEGVAWRTLPPVSSNELGTGWATDPVIWSVDASQIVVGQLDGPSLDLGVETSVVLYDVASTGQPQPVLPWRLGGYGRVTWQVLLEP
jgi:WD40 repeat protein